MGCCASKGKKAEKDPDDKFIDETTIDKLKIQEFDDVFDKGDAPLSGTIDINNKIQTAIEQLMAAGSALFGAFVSEAKIEDGKFSFEIYRPPEKKDDKKLVIAVLTGGPKGKGIDIKEKGLFDDKLAKEDFLVALEKVNVQIESFNKIMADKGKGVKVDIKANRVIAPKEKPADPAELATLNLVKDAANNLNSAYFSVKLGLAKAAFKDGLDIKKIVNQILAKLKSAVGSLVPTVNFDVAGLADGKLPFDIGMGEYKNINDFFDKSDAIPPMLKKAWDHINGKGGLIDCMKEAAAAAAALVPQIKEAGEAIEGLPKDPNEIIEKAKSAGLSPMQAMSVPKKFKNNVEQLARTPEIMKAFMANLEATVKDLAQAIQDFAKDAK